MEARKERRKPHGETVANESVGVRDGLVKTVQKRLKLLNKARTKPTLIFSEMEISTKRMKKRMRKNQLRWTIILT
jgi:hypothetical protein